MGVSSQYHVPADLPPGKIRYSTHCIRGWLRPTAGLDGCGISLPTGIRSSDLPAHSDLPYQLRHTTIEHGTFRISDSHLSYDQKTAWPWWGGPKPKVDIQVWGRWLIAYLVKAKLFSIRIWDVNFEWTIEQVVERTEVKISGNATAGGKEKNFDVRIRHAASHSYDESHRTTGWTVRSPAQHSITMLSFQI
jgi:hypothetical protein